MTPQFILRASLCRKPHCASEKDWKRRAKSEIENLGYAPAYAEPGYTDPKRGVLFANWNYFPSNISDVLERAGYGVEWSDEWDICSDCGKAVRTSPDCFSWQRYYVLVNDCETVCLDCIDWAEYLESIEDNPEKAVVSACHPDQHGYLRLSEPAEYENGMHPGQNDDPAAIIKSLYAAGYKGVIFRIPETSQFYITFETWVKAPSCASVLEYLERELDAAERRFPAIPVSVPNPKAGQPMYPGCQYLEPDDMTNPEWMDTKRRIDALKDAHTLARFAEVR